MRWVVLRLLQLALLPTLWLACAQSPSHDHSTATSARRISQLTATVSTALNAQTEQLWAQLGQPNVHRHLCREQRPQPWLIRSNYISTPDAPAQEVARRKLMHRAAVEYRTRHYGLVEGHGKPEWNAHEPRSYAAEGSFFGIPIRMNARVLIALGCVESALQRECAHTPYRPELISSLRRRNTFNNGEVSNHAFGIAIDINPHENPCCGCVPPLSEWPICKRKGTALERTQIPMCWIDTFERYGFYWLGHDPMQDTMHFEFLGDPDAILAG